MHPQAHRDVLTAGSDNGLKPEAARQLLASPRPATRASTRAQSKSPAPESSQALDSPAIKLNGISTGTRRSARTARVPPSQPVVEIPPRGSALSKRASDLRGLSQLDELAKDLTPRKRAKKSASQSAPTSTKKDKPWKQSQTNDNDEDEDSDAEVGGTQKKSGKHIW